MLRKGNALCALWCVAHSYFIMDHTRRFMIVIDGVIYLLVFSSGVFLLAVTSGVESPH